MASRVVRKRIASDVDNAALRTISSLGDGDISLSDAGVAREEVAARLISRITKALQCLACNGSNQAISEGIDSLPKVLIS